MTHFRQMNKTKEFDARIQALTTDVDTNKKEFDQRKFNIKKWESAKVAVSNGWDWSPVLQAAIKFVMERGGGTIWCPDDDYTFYSDVYSHPSNMDMNFKFSPLTIEGITPVNADLYNTTKKVTRFIKKQAGSTLGINYNNITECVIPSVYRNFSIKNIAFFGGGTTDTKYTKVFASTTKVNGIEKRNAAINIQDCIFWAMDWGIFEPEFVLGSDNYCDQSTFRRLGFSSMGTGWIQSIRPDASKFEAIYGYDMAITCKYGVRAKKGESFSIQGILCAGKAMHLAKDFKLVSLEYCNSAGVYDFYMERLEGLGFWLDSCKNITFERFDVRHYSGVMGRGVNNRNVKIKDVYAHVEENKALSASDPGDYSVYDTITPPLNFDFDNTNIKVEYENEFYRNGVHSSTGFSETTARLTSRRNTTSKAIYQLGQQYIFDVVNDGTNFVVSNSSGQVSFGTLFASSNPTFNTATGELTFPTDGAFANISAAHVSGRRSGTGKINQAFKVSTNPLIVRLYDNTMTLITTAADVAFSVTLHT
ncbi:hypothetical protein [Priestia megaterium]|uniref:hypothetical protein n=1 Tax=Priestia megaterium TaxID=1404 RepID=UPI000BFCCE1B|nr:hypothetical protein [Priestia megaterium]PGQ88285.1 hypothetical protein COA18_04980 [Priestia megaterium]